VIPLQMLVAALLGWLNRDPPDVIAFLREENRVLKAQLGRRRLKLDDDQRRRPMCDTARGGLACGKTSGGWLCE
jgi:hypothetical protein